MKITLLFFLIYTTSIYSQITGCTDSLAVNFNPNATINDGSCRYKKSKIKPETRFTLSDSIAETSGLVAFHQLFWTHNDDHDTTIYGLNKKGKIQSKIKLEKVKNTDWEDIAQDTSYLYIGDFGNNYRGNRTDLHILRIEKESFLARKPLIDTISFSYSNQVDFNIQKPNTSNFDCEAFVVTKDSIYLFSKEWTQNKTAIYTLPKKPAKYVAQIKKSLEVNGLITGATLIESKNTIVLCGYSKKLKPFVYLIYDTKNFNFSLANKRKIQLKLAFHQIESIASPDGKQFYLTNESFVKKPFFNTLQQIQTFDLGAFIKQ